MNRTSRTLLIVDDSPEDRELYRRYLLRDQEYSYTILEASLGRQGLELWQQHHADAVLLDYRLPDLDGLEFLAQLQSSLPQPCLPVIMVTGQGNEAIAVQAMKAGAQDYLIKEEITPEGLQLALNGTIETVRLRNQLQQRIERERVVAQISQKLHQSLDLEEILQTTVTEVRQFLQTDRVLVFRLQTDGWGLVTTESVGSEWTPLLSTSLYDPCFNENYIESFCQGLVTVKPDIHDGSIAPCHVELLANLQVRANLVVPILQDRQLWGMLIAHHCAAPRQWQPLEIDLLRELAIQVGIALQQAELYQQARSELAERQRAEEVLRQQTNRERLVAQMAQRVRQTLNLNEILQTTVEEVRQFLQTDRVFVYRFQPDFSGVVVVESVGENWLPILDAQVEDQYFIETRGEDYRQGRIQAVADIYTAGLTECHVDLLARFQVRANLAVPILYGEALWGLLVANHCAAPREWQLLEIELLQQLTTQVGIAIQQAELYQQAQDELAERRRIEAELRESEERLRLALEASRMGTWGWNIQTGQISWSNNLEALYGLEPGEFDGSFEMFATQLHPDDRAQVMAAIRNAVTTGADYNIEFRVVYPNGTMRWALAQGKVFYDSTGQPLRMAGIDMDITERKRSEQALQESEKRFRTSVENMLDCFGIYRAIRDGQGQIVDFRVEYVNDAACLNNHMTREQQIGRGLCELLPGHHDSGLFDEYCQVVETGQPLVRENLVYEDEYGQQSLVRAFDIRVAKFGDGFVATWRDVTDRKQAEEKLRASEEALRVSEAELRTIANAAPALVWACSATGEVIFMNERWYEYTGQSLEEALGLGWVSALHPDDAARILPYWQRCRATGEPYEGEVRYRRKDGEYRWHQFRALPQRNGSNTIEKWFGCSVDIHDAKRVEEVIAANEARLRGFVEANVVGMLYGDIYGNIHDANDELLRIVGYTREDLRTGKLRWIDITPPEHLPLDEQAIAEARTNGACTPYEKDYIRKDGSRVPVLMGYSLVGEAREESVAFILDVTERKAAEAQREQLLQREQAARAEAERANRIKDEFLAVLSHELRSPLNPILGWAKLLQTHKLDESRTIEALATIERNAKLQTQLIDDLLDVAKILRGKLSLNIAPVNLSFVIEAAIDTVRTAVVAKAISLHAVLPKIGQVSGDAARLQQVVWNLLSNAIKFTPKHGRVDIRLEQVMGNRSLVIGEDPEQSSITHHPSPITHYAQMTVTDTGKGINPAFLPHLFESFRQEDASTTRKYGGLGLGLAIVRQLVEAHGGTIAADSPGEGLGATFTVRLPLLNAEPEHQPSQALPQPELNLAGIRVLAVDDNPDARELLTVLLCQYGAEVLTVASAAEALDTLESFQPTVLISDIGMPDMDGYALIQQIRALPAEQGGQLPAIALTAYAREEDQQRALKSGYQQHVTKPIEPEQLVQAVVSCRFW